MRPFPLFATLVFFICAIDTAQGFWWGWRCHAHGHYGYSAPAYYCPPVVYQPLCVMPCEAMTAMPYLAPPRVVLQTSQAPLPERRLPSAKAMPAEATPYAEIKPAAMTVPAEEKPENKLPKTDLPKVESPKIEFTAPKVPETPRELPKIEMPNVAAPKLELPPLATPTVPKLELPPLPTKSTANYRPDSRLNFMPLAGTSANGNYALRFENYSDRDVTLSVHGQSMTLAAKHAVTATVPAKFAWKLGDATEEVVTVADDVSGYTISIK